MTSMLTTLEKAIFLKELDFFAQTSFEQAAAVARITEELRFEPGDVIIEQNAPAEHVYLPIEGRTIIERDGIVVNVLGPGHGYGDLSMVPGATYNVGARAATNLHVLRMGIEDLSDTMLEYPEVALAVIRALAQRLRDVSQQLADLNRQWQDGSHAARIETERE